MNERTSRVGDERTEAYEVIEAFAIAHPEPNAEDVSAWQVRYPDHAKDIAEFAVSLSDDVTDDMREVVATAMAMYGQAMPFDMLVEAAGGAPPGMADRIGIAPAILDDLIAGRIAPPIPNALVDAMALDLHRAPIAVVRGLEVGHSRREAADLRQDSSTCEPMYGFRQAIEKSTMTDERKAHWLTVD